MGPLVIVPTCKKFYHLLRPFAYLFNIYWSELQPVMVAGFETPDFDLPANFRFYSAAPESWPASQWSDHLIKALRDANSETVVILLEDYWMRRSVDHRGVNTLNEYMRNHQDVLRMDLTADRLYAGGMYEVDSWGCYDILETPPSTQYQMSLQAGIWNSRNLLRVLRPGLTPWEVELQLSNEIPQGLRILGTRQWPVRYANVSNGGKAELVNLHEIPQEHTEAMRQKGYIP